MAAQAKVAEVRNRLIEQGWKSYADAILAIHEFRKEIQERCRDVLAGRLTVLSDALGEKLEEGDIKPLSWPKEDWGISDPSLGSQVKVNGFGDLHCYLWWDTQDVPGELVLKATCSVMPDRQANDVLRIVKKVGGKAEPCDGELYVAKPLAGIEGFTDRLGDILDEWVAVWQKIGGVRGLSKQLSK